MKLNIPYLSYNIEAVNRELSTEGITCAKMVMDFYGFSTNEDIRDLLSWGNSIGACDKDPFMIDSLVVLLQAHGFRAYKEIFRNNSFDFILANALQEIYDKEYRENGIAAIVASIAESVPVITLMKDAADIHAEEHVVLMYGFEAAKGELTGFYYHDPASDESGEGQFISLETFRKAWKRTAVFLDR